MLYRAATQASTRFTGRRRGPAPTPLLEAMMTSAYLHSPTRSRRRPTWRRWVLLLIGIAVLCLAPALAHSDTRSGCVTGPTGTDCPVVPD